MSTEQEIIFTSQTTGRLDSVLGSEEQVVAALHGFSRSQAAQYVQMGRVTLNGRIITKTSYQVKRNDEIRVRLEERSMIHTAYAQELEVVHEDDFLVVINKPAGLTMHPGAGNKNKTLLNALVHHYTTSDKKLPPIFEYAGSERIGIVHRIDKDTSGLVVVAKTLEVLQDLQKQFQAHTVKRTYVALCLTTPRARNIFSQANDGTIEGMLRRHVNKRKTFELVKTSSAGKFSKTMWQVLERFPYGVLVSCKLETGRTHQIRVHFQAMGCSLAGDTTYGNASHLPKALAVACEKLSRQALHARSLGFIHPQSKKELYFEAPLPEDMQKIIALFKGWKGST